MAWNEKPPILTGQSGRDLANLRDYLFRMAQSLTEVETAAAVKVSYAKDGTQILTPAGNADDAATAIARNAQELKSLIVKSADALRQQIIDGDAAVTAYTDSKEEAYDGKYLAVSAFGTFEENLNTRIATTARGVVESFNYSTAIESVQDSIGLLQGYYDQIQGEIRRGLVLDPETNTYVIGIVISQQVSFSGVVEHTDPNYPGDGNEYYYVSPEQTFGIYTATGWQFWINGMKRGWFSSQDSMLHVSQIVVEQKLQGGSNWEITFDGGFGIKYTGA